MCVAGDRYAIADAPGMAVDQLHLVDHLLFAIDQQRILSPTDSPVVIDRGASGLPAKYFKHAFDFYDGSFGVVIVGRKVRTNRHMHKVGLAPKIV